MLENSDFQSEILEHLFYKNTILESFVLFEIEFLIFVKLLNTKLKKINKYYLYYKNTFIKINFLKVVIIYYVLCI